eukprot:5266484-Amphidinium_carterae.1
MKTSPSFVVSFHCVWWDAGKETLHIETLYDVLDKMCKIPERPISAPMRMPISGRQLGLSSLQWLHSCPPAAFSTFMLLVALLNGVAVSVLGMSSCIISRPTLSNSFNLVAH